jgi:hypothetical protein
MTKEVIKCKCGWCGSEDISFEQDNHQKRIQGVNSGVLICSNCNQIAFWYFKVKEKISFEGNIFSSECTPKLVIVDQWDGAVSPFLYDHMTRASELTGRPLTSYYTNIIIEKDKPIAVRYLDFTEIKEAFLNTKEHILGR